MAKIVDRIDVSALGLAASAKETKLLRSQCLNNANHFGISEGWHGLSIERVGQQSSFLPERPGVAPTLQPWPRGPQ